MKLGLLDSPSMAFMQKRRAGGKSCQFFLSITGRQNRVRASGNKGRTRNKRSVRHKELFLHLLILQSKFIYSQAFTWDNAQSYNNILRMSSPDAKAQLVEEAAGGSPRRTSDGRSQFCPNPSQITARTILELRDFVRAPFSDQETCQVCENWEHPIQANLSLSLYLDEKSELFTPRLSWQSPKIHGAQRECRFEENSSCTACCCVWRCWYPGEVCNSVCELHFPLTFDA